jgi:hypothetical protein
MGFSEEAQCMNDELIRDVSLQKKMLSVNH